MRRILPTLLFTLAALASFSVWAFGSRLYQSEYGLYASCALVFLGLGGLALVPGQGLAGGKPVIAFLLRFAAGFASYSLIWSIIWFTFQNTFGEITGSFFGYLAMISILRPARVRENERIIGATAIVFLWSALGYYSGGFAYETLQNRGAFAIDLPMDRSVASTLARLAWGLFYGLGLGYGLASVLQPRR